MARDSAFRPPLVRNLFDAGYSEILRQYPFAQMAAADIRRELEHAVNGSVAIEEYIRQTYRDGEAEIDHRKFYALPWYLQHLLTDASSRYTKDPDNLHLLLTHVMRFPEVIFITLNYDTILDERLSNFDAIAGFADYIDPARRWKLIKPHGSVNWGRVLGPDFEQDWIVRPPTKLKAISPELTFAPLTAYSWNDDPGLLGRYRRTEDGRALFPALSVPLGSPDEVVSPPEHLRWLDARLAEERYHLLVLGYSAWDDEVLSLLRRTKGVPVSGRIVVSGWDEGVEVHRRLGDGLKLDVSHVIPAQEDFESFVQGTGIAEYIEELKAGHWNPWE